MGRISRAEEGQALIETGLVILILIPFILGVLAFGYAYYSYIAVTNASREGARYGARNPCYTNISGTSVINSDAIENAAQTELNTNSRLSTTGACTIGSSLASDTSYGGGGWYVEVTTTCPNFSLSPLDLLRPITLTNTTRMKVEGTQITCHP